VIGPTYALFHFSFLNILILSTATEVIVDVDAFINSNRSIDFLSIGEVRRSVARWDEIVYNYIAENDKALNLCYFKDSLLDLLNIEETEA
jgi:hypothetical protein